jgi:hypothetical protein
VSRSRDRGPRSSPAKASPGSATSRSRRARDQGPQDHASLVRFRSTASANRMTHDRPRPDTRPRRPGLNPRRRSSATASQGSSKWET